MSGFERLGTIFETYKEVQAVLEAFSLSLRLNNSEPDRMATYLCISRNQSIRLPEEYKPPKFANIYINLMDLVSGGTICQESVDQQS